MKATKIRVNTENGHGKQTSGTEVFESVRCCSLTPQRYSHLWLSEMPATCFTHTYFDAIKMFQYFRHFHVTKLGKILLTSKKISAKSKLLSFGTGT